MCGRKGSVSEGKKKKRKEDERDCSVACALQKGTVCGDSRKGGDPPAFVNERGSQCTYEGKGAVSGEKEKRKKKKIQTRWQGRRACRFEEKGTPSHLQARGGPCAPVRKGEQSGGRRQKRNLTIRRALLWTLVGGEEPEKWQTWSDHAESRVSDVALLEKFPRLTL